jgi:hypothetical protein
MSQESTSAFISNLRNKILDTDKLTLAIELSEMLGRILWVNALEVYQENEIEQHNVDLAREFLKPEASVPNKDCIHVITDPLLTGGHTRLMERLSTMHDNKPDILITGVIREAKIQQRIETFFETVYVANSTSKDERLKNIYSLLKSYKRVVLHIDPSDISVISACGVLREVQATKVYFVNHADHVFSFGGTISNVYFQISKFGAIRDKQKGIEADFSYLGIPIVSDVTAIDDNNLNSVNINFISAGTAYKYKPLKYLSFNQTAQTLLDRYPQSTLTVIGIKVATDYWWWLLKLKYRSRLRLYKTLSFDKYMQITKSADFYIDSYPVPGGTAFAEQLLSGVRCIGMVSPFQGYSPIEKLKQKSLNELIQTIEHKEDYNTIYSDIEQVHGLQSVKDRYLGALYNAQYFSIPDVLQSNELMDVSFFNKTKITYLPHEMVGYALKNISFLKFIVVKLGVFCTAKGLVKFILKEIKLFINKSMN